MKLAGNVTGMALFALTLWGEKVSPLQLVAIILGFTGVLAVVEPWGAGSNPAMPYLIGASLHSLVTLAHRMADASVLAPVFYLQLLFASVAGYLVFGPVPGPSTLFWALIMILGGSCFGCLAEETESPQSGLLQSRFLRNNRLRNPRRNKDETFALWP